MTAFWFISRDLLEKFSRYGIGSDISSTILVFLNYFEEKLMTSFKKIKTKKNCFGVILALFARILENMNFPGRDDQSIFKYSNYLPSCQNVKKLTILRKILNWKTESTDRQTTVILYDPL